MVGVGPRDGIGCLLCGWSSDGWFQFLVGVVGQHFGFGGGCCGRVETWREGEFERGDGGKMIRVPQSGSNHRTLGGFPARQPGWIFSDISAPLPHEDFHPKPNNNFPQQLPILFPPSRTVSIFPPGTSSRPS